MANVRLAVIYYSATGTTFQLARAVEEGAKAAGAEVRLRKVRELAPEDAIKSNAGWSQHRLDTQNVPDATLEDLTWADAYVFGCPTRYGLPAAQLKQFFDETGPLWAKGALANKVASSFTSTATAHGGQESTILAINNVLYHWGAIIVGPGYLEPNQFKAGNPYGASHISANGTIPPDEIALASARFQGKRTAEIAAKIVAAR
jgi:NAD(P)H dehydrogenase (quinone)